MSDRKRLDALALYPLMSPDKFTTLVLLISISIACSHFVWFEKPRSVTSKQFCFSSFYYRQPISSSKPEISTQMKQARSRSDDDLIHKFLWFESIIERLVKEEQRIMDRSRHQNTLKKHKLYLPDPQVINFEQYILRNSWKK